jgi:hypothetical protein
MTMICDLSAGEVSITASGITCNGTTSSENPDLLFQIINTREATASISVGISSVTLVFTHVTSEPFVTVSNSFVTFLFEAANKVAQIACDGGSNVTLGAITGGSVSVSLPPDALLGAGIGTPRGGACSSLFFLNGSFQVDGESWSAAIGTGAAEDVTSALEQVVIVGAAITASSGAGGAPFRT